MINVLSLFDGMSCAQIALNKLGVEFNYFASEIDKYAVKVSSKKYPAMIHLGDVTQWQSWDLPKIDLLIGGSPCFVGDTRVITTTGYKQIKDIRIGDKVLTHTNHFQSVVSIGNTRKQVYQVKAQGIPDVFTTKEHPFYVRQMKRVWNNEKRTYQRYFNNPMWVKASELQKDDFIGINVPMTEENPLKLTMEDCWLLGRYIADGHLRCNKRPDRQNSYQYQVIFSIGAKKLQHFQEKVTRHFSCFPHSESVFRCVISSKKLVEFLQTHNVGQSANTKNFPAFVFNLPATLAEQVLEGYMSGDGCKRHSGYKATTVSKELALGLVRLVAKCYRVNANVEFCKRPTTTVICGRTVNQQDTYTVSFHKEMKLQSKAIILDDIVWLRFREGKQLNEVQTVYNLEVAVDNSYTANNAIVHNCQGFSLAGKGLNFDDERSKLFFEFAKIKDHLQAQNPDLIFVLENVKMAREHEQIITQYMGVHPIEINSALVSAQHRKRLYWTNILAEPFNLFGELKSRIPQPADKGILLKDILETNVDKKYFLSDAALGRIERSNYSKPGINPDKTGTLSCKNNSGQLQLDSGTTLVTPDKSYCIDASYFKGGTVNDYVDRRRRQLVRDDVSCVAMRGRGDDNQQTLEVNSTGKTNSLTSVQKDNLVAQGLSSQSDKKRRIDEKAATLVAASGGDNYPTVFLSEPMHKHGEERFFTNKAPTIAARPVTGGNNVPYVNNIRRLTPVECCRLQTVPDDYFWHNGEQIVSDSQMYKMLGNGFTIDIVAYILSFMELDVI